METVIYTISDDSQIGIAAKKMVISKLESVQYPKEMLNKVRTDKFVIFSEKNSHSSGAPVVIASTNDPTKFLLGYVETLKACGGTKITNLSRGIAVDAIMQTFAEAMDKRFNNTTIEFLQ